jgi:hypothetical protein
MYVFNNKAGFYGEEILGTRPTDKLEVYSLSGVRYYVFNIRSYPPTWKPFLHPNQRTRDAVGMGHTYNGSVCYNLEKNYLMLKRGHV